MIGAQHAAKDADRLLTSLSDDGRYRLLVEAITDYAIYMLDADGIVASWNPGARRFKGYEEHEIIGKHFSLFYTEEDRRAGLPQRALFKAKNEGRFEGQGWRVRKDGSRFWAGVVIDPIRMRDGTVVGFAKVTRDITEKKIAEEKLYESQEQFRLLVQGVSDYAIYMLDPSGYVTNWNIGAQKIKGYLPGEIIGRHFSQFFIDEDRAAGRPSHAIETAAREGKFESEGWRVRKDGTRFWAHAVIDAIRSPEGKLIGFAKITRDITERRNAQKALERAQEALFQSQKLEAVGQLTGGIAHDFNNLLMAIMGSLELAGRRASNDPKLKQILENALSGVRRGVTLIQRMLAFARRQDLKVTPVRIADVLNGMNELIERSLGPTIRVSLHTPASLPYALADVNQLEAAILNLVLNARDAMAGGGIIDITARSERIGDGSILSRELAIPPGDYICLAVTDRGEGMDETTLKRAAEPFFTTKGVGKGTGLGLPMVHGTMEQLGGRLILKSVKGEGTTAELWLPCAGSETASTAGPADRTSLADASGSDRFKILVVDDDPLILMNTVALLEELGHGVEGVASAKEALEIFRARGNFDLVITDQGMPHMTGLELATRIRAEQPDFPIVLATGYAELPSGGSELVKLPKPYSLFDLETAVTRIMAAG